MLRLPVRAGGELGATTADEPPEQRPTEVGHTPEVDDEVDGVW